TAVGLALGTLVTLTIQAWRTPEAANAARPAEPGLTELRTETPATFLAWVPGGLPAGFATNVRDAGAIRDVTAVAEDDTSLVRSWDSAGELVDHPPKLYRIPLDTAAVDPASWATFLPPADQTAAGALA